MNTRTVRTAAAPGVVEEKHNYAIVVIQSSSRELLSTEEL